MFSHHHATMALGQAPNKRARKTTAALFKGHTIDVARRLIGATLERRIPRGEPDAGTLVRGRIVETEAYLPLVDPACHAYRGRTKRNAVMFGDPGRAYVYFIYGNHYCLNVTTERPGTGAAVLIRAVEPTAGLAAMRHRRLPGTTDYRLASGPGNLCRAFSIDRRCDGKDLRSGVLRIIARSSHRPIVKAAKRVGLSVAQDWPLRFYDASSRSVSKTPAP
jgi:DNA-3-methyladenine glycosylase